MKKTLGLLILMGVAILLAVVFVVQNPEDVRREVVAEATEQQQQFQASEVVNRQTIKTSEAAGRWSLVKHDYSTEPIWTWVND
jgi:hypothetical protein